MIDPHVSLKIRYMEERERENDVGDEVIEKGPGPISSEQQHTSGASPLFCAP